MTIYDCSDMLFLKFRLRFLLFVVAVILHLKVPIGALSEIRVFPRFHRAAVLPHFYFLSTVNWFTEWKSVCKIRCKTCKDFRR